MSSHILLYTDNPSVGGVPQYNHSLLCKLATSGYQVSAVQIEQSNPLVEEQMQLGIKQLWLEANLTTGYARSYTDLDTPRRLLSAAQPDLIIFSDGWPLGNFAAKQVALEMGIPYMIVVGFVDANSAKVAKDDGIPYPEVASYHYNCAQAVVAVSEENLDLLRNLFDLPEECGQVIYYGRPKEFFAPTETLTRRRLRSEIGVPDDAIICFTSARLAWIKGFDLQLDAIEQLQQSPVWDKLYFVWAGTGIAGEDVKPQLLRRIKFLEVENRIKLIGERWDIPDWLGASDIYILTSRAEGMPLAIMEAMAKGLPVMASAVSGIPEELADNGKLLPDPKVDSEATVAELVATIETWATNTQLRQEVGIACQQRAKKLFTQERMLDDYLDAIAQVLQSSNSPSVNLSQAATISPEQKSLLHSRVSYAYLVWKAWYHHRQGDLAGMAQTLQQSLAHTPFLKAETILNWIESFARFSQEQEENLDTYTLCQLPQWQQLVSGIW